MKNAYAGSCIDRIYVDTRLEKYRGIMTGLLQGAKEFVKFSM